MFVVAGMVFLIWRNASIFRDQLQSFFICRGFAILWAGFTVAVIYSQLFGHGEFLEALMGDDYVRGYKRLIEEVGELFGYALIIIGSIELTLETKEPQMNWGEG